MGEAGQGDCHADCWAYRVMDVETEVILGHLSKEHDIPTFFTRALHNKILNRRQLGSSLHIKRVHLLFLIPLALPILVYGNFTLIRLIILIKLMQRGLLFVHGRAQQVPVVGHTRLQQIDGEVSRFYLLHYLLAVGDYCADQLSRFGLNLFCFLGVRASGEEAQLVAEEASLNLTHAVIAVFIKQA